jgi:hypothetical protein
MPHKPPVRRRPLAGQPENGQPKAAPSGAEPGPPRFDHHPHDALFRYVFRRSEHAAAALRTWLPAELLGHLDLAQLQRVDPVTGDDRLGERRADLVFQATFAARPALIQFVIEHQSTVDRDMALRLLRSLVDLWTDWRRRHPRGALPPIVPCVVHHGPRRWTAPRDLQGLLDLGPEATAQALRPLLPQLRYLLDDLNRASEDQLRERPWPALPKLTALLLKFTGPETDFGDHLPRWADLVGDVVDDEDRDAWPVVVRYILTATPTDPRALADKLEGHLPGPAQEEIMATVDNLYTRTRAAGRAEGLELGLEKGRSEGRSEGRNEGRNEGRTETLRATLRKLLRLRFGGEASPALLARIEAADADALDRWTERVLTAPTAAAVLAD